MTRHLSSAEISKWIAGERNRRSEDHLSECAECRGELAHFQGRLSDFRAVVRAWSQEQSAAAPLPAWRMGRTHSSPRLRWALIAAAMVVLAAIPIYRASQPRPSSDHSLDDTVLLEQIDDGVSRSVPAPMEPLTTLVSWGSGAQDAPSQQKKK